MRKKDWPYLILGLLLTTAACRPITEEDPNVVTTDSAPATVPATSIAGQITVTPATEVATPTPTLPPRPTAVPTRDPMADWPVVGDESTGIQLAMPPDWLDLSQQLDVATATNQLGLTTLFLVDGERTGVSLLSDKEIDGGAFVMVIMTNQDLPLDSPRSSLTTLLGQLSIDSFSPIEAVTAASPTGVVAGATTDIVGDPKGFPIVEGQDFQMRLLLFPVGQDVQSSVTTHAMLLMGARAEDWPLFAEVFDGIASRLTVYRMPTNFAIGGQANIVGELQNMLPVEATLSAGVGDVWTFVASEGRYATLTLSTETADLDLRLTILNASGQVVTTADNGFTGDTEIAADVLLAMGGRYFVEVEDFFDNTGRYSLGLSLSEEPLYSGGGRILLGQTIQSVLPPGQHLWSFEGTAGQRVSVVLVPTDERLDAILNLYGPDGRRLVALDEGFSGDAEVVSGFELPVTGEYTILISSFADAGGAYSLSLDEGGEVTENFYEAGDIGYGESRQESLQPFEAHVWYFTGQAGDEVSVRVMPLDAWLDIDVWLLDANVERIAAQDEFLAGESETVGLTLPADGQYVILVRDFFGETGRYEVELNGPVTQSPTYAGALNYGEAVGASLTATVPVFWLFEGHEGDVIDIQLTPVDAVDFLFVLQTPEGEPVARVDTNSLGNVERLEGFMLTADGSWRIVVESFFEEGGAYSLLVER